MLFTGILVSECSWTMTMCNIALHYVVRQAKHPCAAILASCDLYARAGTVVRYA